MNTPKKTLVAELTAALGPVLHAQPGAAEALPKPVEKAIEQLAETVLRWRGRQDAVTAARPKRNPSDSDQLAHLMRTQLTDEADIDESSPLPTSTMSAPPKAKRMRLPKST